MTRQRIARGILLLFTAAIVGAFVWLTYLVPITAAPIALAVVLMWAIENA
jgi:hypothetical protein